MKWKIAEHKMYPDPPLSSTGDRQTSKLMAFVSALQRQKLLCCQIDEKALFGFLFVVALVLLLVFLLFFCERRAHFIQFF